MSRGRGYLLPNNLEPEEDRCLVVYIPNEQRYVDAFWGSLDYLATWMAWERTGDTKAAIAAQRWKHANLRTFDANLAVDCELLNDLLEDGDMSVNITNNVTCAECGGSCSGAGNCSPVIAPQPEVHDLPSDLIDEVRQRETQSDPGGENVPPGFDTRAEYEFYKCKAARALARDAIDTVGNLETLGVILSAGGLTLLLASITNTAILSTLAAPLVMLGLTAGGGLLAVAIILAALLMAATVGPVMFLYFQQLHDALVLQLDDFTCELFCAENETQSRQVFEDRVLGSLATLVYDDASHESIFTEVVRKVLEFFIPAGYFGLLFWGLEKVQEYIEGRDDGFDCSVCECEEEEPPTGFQIIDAINVTQNQAWATGTITINGNEVVFSGSTVDGSDPTGRVDVEHGELFFTALFFQIFWDVGTWKNERFGTQLSTPNLENGNKMILYSQDSGAANRAIIDAWAAERGYLSHHSATNHPAGSVDPVTHGLRLLHTAGLTSNATVVYRFIVPI